MQTNIQKTSRRFMACLMAAVLLTLSGPAAGAKKASDPSASYDGAYPMGQVTFHLGGAFPGSDAFGVYIDLNGYMPQSVTWVMKGDFTEEEARTTFEAYKAGKLRGVRGSEPWTVSNYYNGFVYNPLNAGIDFPMYAETCEEWHSDMNVVHRYRHNVYMAEHTATRLTYAYIPPGDRPVKCIEIEKPYHVAAHIYDESTGLVERRATRYELYMDGQLMMEVTVSGDGYKTKDENVFRTFTIHPANFQSQPQEPQALATPTTSKMFLNGSRAEIGAYLIGGNNYVMLRDVAALLNGTTAQFDIEYHAENNLIELLRGTPYSEVNAAQTMPAEPVTAQLSTAQLMYETTWKASRPPEEPPQYWPENRTYKFPYPYYSNLRTVDEVFAATGKTYTYYVADVPEYFLPKAYNIAGRNYYKLRDLAHILGFSVEWDASTGSVLITTPAQDG